MVEQNNEIVIQKYCFFNKISLKNIFFFCRHSKNFVLGQQGEQRVAHLRPRPAELLDGGKNDCDLGMFCDGTLDISLAGMMEELGPDC